MITIRKTVPEDLDAVWHLVQTAVADMNDTGNPQWGEDYPTRDHYEQALLDGELYAACDTDGAILGVAVLNTTEEPQYDALPWRTPSPALVIHKLAVSPKAQRKGVARALFQYAYELAQSWGVSSVHMDTYSVNERMLALMSKEGFQYAGELFYPDRPLPFLAHEKDLSGQACL